MAADRDTAAAQVVVGSSCALNWPPSVHDRAADSRCLPGLSRPVSPRFFSLCAESGGKRRRRKGSGIGEGGCREGGVRQVTAGARVDTCPRERAHKPDRSSHEEFPETRFFSVGARHFLLLFSFFSFICFLLSSVIFRPLVKDQLHRRSLPGRRFPLFFPFIRFSAN